MECMLLPNLPARPNARVPYVCTNQYDGKDWRSYPVRMGISRMVDDSTDPYHLPYSFVERADPTPTKEQEAFFQTWLFFGLICEALDGNVSDPEASLAVNDESVSESPTQRMVLHSIYDKYIVIENDTKYITTVRLLPDLEESWALSPVNDREKLLARCRRLRLCLWRVNVFLPLTSADFDLRVKFSISAVAEIISQMVHKITNSDEVCPTGWGKSFYRTHISETQEPMRRLGWCPSDVSRCRDKFGSLQLLHFLSMLDRSKPCRLSILCNRVELGVNLDRLARDHENCNDIECKAFSTNANTYKVGHVDERCSCKAFFIKGFRSNFKFARALAKPGCVPLLRFVGDISNLKVEIVEATQTTPYVAISHVWADGLGNPNANALYNCQSVRIRSLVRLLSSSPVAQSGVNFSSPSLSEPLFWIDTICCPVSPPRDKKAALKKMRLVYENAASVLVLDASLQLYESRSMDLVEKLARVMTSGWLRRLWTLQEGALAQLLYFQFADEAISLSSLQAEIKEASNDLRHQLIYGDFLSAYQELRQFFHSNSMGQSGPDLNVLSRALSHRGVSEPSDEAICIGTLMSIPIEKIVETSGIERTKVMWSLLMEKIKVIPSDVIFYEDDRLDVPGWRWAPKSLLNVKPQLLNPEHRFLQVSDTQLAIPTPGGLQVRYPGFRLQARQLDGDKPRLPWQDVFRLPKALTVFRDLLSKQWYMLAVEEYFRGNEEQKDAYEALNVVDLQDMIRKGNCLVLMQNGDPDGSGLYAPYAPPGAENTYQLPVMGVLAGLVQDKSESKEGDSCLSSAQSNKQGALVVRTAEHVIVGPVDSVENGFYNAIESCALQLRSDPVTDTLLAIKDRDTAEWKSGFEDVKRRTREMATNILEQDPALMTGLRSLFGDDTIEHLWVMILDWFNHDFVGTRLPDDQIWIVD